MKKNRIKSLAIAGLTGLAAILSNDNSKAGDLLEVRNLASTTVDSAQILYLQHISGGLEGADSNDSTLPVSPPGSKTSWLKCYTSPYVTPLSTDSRPTNSQTLFSSSLAVTNTLGTSVSTTNRIRFLFDLIDNSRLYLSKVHVSPSWTTNGLSFDSITNISNGPTIIIPGGITNVPNGGVYGTVDVSCLFTNQPNQTNANMFTTDLTSNQVSGLSYAINPANSRASIQNLTNLVWNSSVPTNNDTVKVDLSWSNNVLGSIFYHFSSTNNPPTISDTNMVGSRGINITNAIPVADSDGTVTNIGIAVAPTNGVVTFNNITNAVYNFTNNAAINSSGNVSDFFRLYSVDNNGAISTSTNNVTVNLTNNAPTMTSIGGPFYSRRGRAITNNVFITDINGDTNTLAVAQQGTNGLVSILNNTNWVYTPSNSLPAVDTFKLYAKDGYNGFSATNIGTVNFTNVAPVIPNSVSVSGPKGINTTNALSAFGASDADNDTLTYNIAQQGTNGTFSTLGNTNWTYVPSTNAPLVDNGKIYVSDGFGGFATNNVSVNLTNRVPTLSDMTMIGARGRAITNSIVGNDADGDPLTPHLAVNPTNGIVNFTNGNAIYTPSNNIPTSDGFRFYLTDGYGNSTTNNSSVTLTNQPLVINNDSYTRNLGSTLMITKSDLLTNDSDPNGFALRFSGLPSLVSTNGVSLGTNNTLVGYFCSNSNRFNDAFQYSVTNDHGVGGNGWVNVNVNTNVFGQSKSIVPSNGVVNLQFYGVGGWQYGVERSTNLVDWKNLTNIVSAVGPFNYTDNFSDLGGHAPSSAFYRVRYNP